MTDFRIFCIGRNYSEHAKELNSEVPESPVIFMKPSSCVVFEGVKVPIPQHGKVLHHEAEFVLKIGKAGKPKDLADAASFISEVAIGLDLTLRDVQNSLKDKGLPWELSKAFDYSAPLGRFKKISNNSKLSEIEFTCQVNGIVKQKGTVSDMLFSCERLVLEIGKVWNFIPGDLIYTGTPSGVGPIISGDEIILSSNFCEGSVWKFE